MHSLSCLFLSLFLLHVVCLNIHLCVHRCEQVYVNKWRQTTLRHLPLLLSTLVFETRSVTDPKAHWVNRTTWPVSSRDLPVSALPALGFQVHPPHMTFYTSTWRFKLRSPRLNSRHFTHSSASPPIPTNVLAWLVDLELSCGSRIWQAFEENMVAKVSKYDWRQLPSKSPGWPFREASVVNKRKSKERHRLY